MLKKDSLKRKQKKQNQMFLKKIFGKQKNLLRNLQDLFQQNNN